MDQLIVILLAICFSSLVSAFMCWGVEKRTEQFDIKAWQTQVNINKLSGVTRDIIESRVGKLEARLGAFIADSNDFHARLDALEKQNVCQPKKKNAKA